MLSHYSVKLLGKIYWRRGKSLNTGCFKLIIVKNRLYFVCLSFLISLPFIAKFTKKCMIQTDNLENRIKRNFDYAYIGVFSFDNIFE